MGTNTDFYFEIETPETTPEDRTKLVQAITDAAMNGDRRDVDDAVLALRHFDDGKRGVLFFDIVSSVRGYSVYEGVCDKWYDYALDMRKAMRDPRLKGWTVTVLGEVEDGTRYRHKFTNTSDEKIEPVITWPEFTI
jgi:hypothetical protein